MFFFKLPSIFSLKKIARKLFFNFCCCFEFKNNGEKIPFTSKFEGKNSYLKITEEKKFLVSKR